MSLSRETGPWLPDRLGRSDFALTSQGFFSVQVQRSAILYNIIIQPILLLGLLLAFCYRLGLVSVIQPLLLLGLFVISFLLPLGACLGSNIGIQPPSFKFHQFRFFRFCVGGHRRAQFGMHHEHDWTIFSRSKPQVAAHKPFQGRGVREHFAPQVWPAL